MNLNYKTYGFSFSINFDGKIKLCHSVTDGYLVYERFDRNQLLI